MHKSLITIIDTLSESKNFYEDQYKNYSELLAEIINILEVPFGSNSVTLLNEIRRLKELDKK